MSMPGAGADAVTVDRLTTDFGGDVPPAVLEAAVVVGVGNSSGVPESDLPEPGGRFLRRGPLNSVESRTTAVP
ncbi:hypothetical protein CS378_02640 [Rhodococcus ruber]|nr:hypothetical protein CS378_02640 [Rhodococcus ruber]AUM15296.1 hypothetical protein CSW53_01340 [Rhodococcus ruber]AWG99109.1 hypothetical protein DCN13_11315 [Rhodococcus ruber]RQM33759.1 hypothetical protein TN91_13220 [Rhodococcus ruber]